jgi:hypothetical protein
VQIHRARVVEMSWRILQLALVVALLLSVGGTTMAQDQSDPPGRVARLNYIQGSVSFQPAGTNDWLDANPNRPLTTGDNLWADDDSRGELHIGATSLHISSQTGISFLNLTDQATQIQLAQGVISVHVRELYPDEAFEIDTPNLAFSVLRPGDYRIAVDPNGNSTLIDVRGGSGEVTGGGQAFTLNPGEEYAFSGTDQLSYDAEDLPGPDDFDTWCLQRDQRDDRSASARYVSRDVTGYEDLDDYGSWSQDPEYGVVAGFEFFGVIVRHSTCYAPTPKCPAFQPWSCRRGVPRESRARAMCLSWPRLWVAAVCQPSYASVDSLALYS